MILEIKRKKKEKRIQIVGALLGICVAAAALFFFFMWKRQRQRDGWWRL